MLALLDFDKHFVIEVDTSDKGIDMVLMQKGHPIHDSRYRLEVGYQPPVVTEKLR